jgi:hypothetical protein
VFSPNPFALPSRSTGRPGAATDQRERSHSGRVVARPHPENLPRKVRKIFFKSIFRFIRPEVSATHDPKPPDKAIFPKPQTFSPDPLPCST